jgi:hypothetical protein
MSLMFHSCLDQMYSLYYSIITYANLFGKLQTAGYFMLNSGLNCMNLAVKVTHAHVLFRRGWCRLTDMMIG